jgi:hypothetical protein
MKELAEYLKSKGYEIKDYREVPDADQNIYVGWFTVIAGKIQITIYQGTDMDYQFSPSLIWFNSISELQSYANLLNEITGFLGAK